MALHFRYVAGRRYPFVIEPFASCSVDMVRTLATDLKMGEWGMIGRLTFGLLLLIAAPDPLSGMGVAAAAEGPRSDSDGNRAARKGDCVDVDIAIVGRTAAFHIGVTSARKRGEARIRLPFRLPRDSVFFGFDAAIRKDVLDMGIPLERSRARLVYIDEIRRGNAVGLAGLAGGNGIVAKMRSESGRDVNAATFRFVAPIDPARGVSLVLKGDSRVRSCGLLVSARKYLTPPDVMVGGRRLEFKRGNGVWEALLKGKELTMAGDVTVTGGALAQPAWISWSDREDVPEMVNPTFFVADDVRSGDLGPSPRPAVTSVTDGSGRAIAYRVLPAADGRWSIVGPAPISGPIQVGLSDGSTRTYAPDYDEFPNFGPGIFWARPLVDGLMRDPARRQDGLNLALRYRMLGSRMSYLVLRKLDQYRRAGLAPPRDVLLDAEDEDEAAPGRAPPSPSAPASPKPARD